MGYKRLNCIADFGGTPDTNLHKGSAMLIKTASQSLNEQLCLRFADRIPSRLLAPGARLPSMRLCAAQQGVSVSAVVAAYDQLQAQGLIVAQKNRGFFIREFVSNRLFTHEKRTHEAIKNIANAPVMLPP